MSVKVYEYRNCGTCKKALRFLDGKGVKYERIPILDRAPGVPELERMLSYVKSRGGSYKNLFNTSGQLYRELSIADKIKAGMTEREALRLLSRNGKLIKRPFVLSERDGMVGFKEADWKGFFL